MKLVINYDLINEINNANTGINIKRISAKMGIYMGTLLTLNIAAALAGSETAPTNITFGIVNGIIIFGGSEFALKEFTKKAAEKRLRTLAPSLSKINIYTDLESLKSARLYKTQYKIVKDEKPSIMQTKFIMLPTTNTLNADEISLQQEHNLGSKEYVLSIGEPKKSESKILSKVLSSQSI